MLKPRSSILPRRSVCRRLWGLMPWGCRRPVAAARGEGAVDRRRSGGLGGDAQALRPLAGVDVARGRRAGADDGVDALPVEARAVGLGGGRCKNPPENRAFWQNLVESTPFQPPAISVRLDAGPGPWNRPGFRRISESVSEWVKPLVGSARDSPQNQ